MTNGRFTVAFGSSLRGALHSDAGSHGCYSGCKHEHLDSREAIHIPISAASRDRNYMGLEISRRGKLFPAKELHLLPLLS